MDSYITVVVVPFPPSSTTNAQYSQLRSLLHFEPSLYTVVSSPSDHTLEVARIFSQSSVVVDFLSVSGESTATDVYRRHKKSQMLKHKPWLANLPGFAVLKERWWPMSFEPWRKTQVPKFLKWVRSLSSSRRRLLAVVTQVYASELFTQIHGAESTRVDTVKTEAGECRTYRLCANGTSEWLKAESYTIPCRDHNAIRDEWEQSMMKIVHTHFNVTATSLDDLLKKARLELKNHDADCIAVKNTRNDAVCTRVNAMPPRGNTTCCVDCGADLMHTLYDAQSGDTLCGKCGVVHTSHKMDNKATFRTFEGEKDLNHNATSVNAFMDVSNQLQTGRSRMPTVNHSQYLPSVQQVEQMALESVHTRSDLTTQITRDKQIRKACNLYANVQGHPSTNVPAKLLELAKQIFYVSRNKEVSLQPVGLRKKTHRPKDETFLQHVATSFLAAGLRLQEEDTQAKCLYVCRDTGPTYRWDTQRVGSEGNDIVALAPSRKRRHSSHTPESSSISDTKVYGKPGEHRDKMRTHCVETSRRKRRRMTNIQSLKASVNARLAKRAELLA